MKYLLDTHIFLWWLDADKRLSRQDIEIIKNPKNIKFLSVASIWEIVIKAKAKKLPLTVSVSKLLDKFQFDILNIELTHVLEVDKLPNIHKDPFDRIIIAQAKVEGLELLSSDRNVLKYLK
jgi:PIN domain nuclease of toxin-antitoxin system